MVEILHCKTFISELRETFPLCLNSLRRSHTKHRRISINEITFQRNSSEIMIKIMPKKRKRFFPLSRWIAASLADIAKWVSSLQLLFIIHIIGRHWSRSFEAPRIWISVFVAHSNAFCWFFCYNEWLSWKCELFYNIRQTERKLFSLFAKSQRWKFSYLLWSQWASEKNEKKRTSIKASEIRWWIIWNLKFLQEDDEDKIN